MFALDLIYRALPIAAIIYYLVTAAFHAAYGNRQDEGHQTGARNLITVKLCAMFVIGLSYSIDSTALIRLILSGQVQIRQDTVPFALSSALLWFVVLVAYSEPRTSFWHSLLGCTVMYLCAEMFFMFTRRAEQPERLSVSILFETVRTFRLFILISLLFLLLIARAIVPRRRPYDEEALLEANDIHSIQQHPSVVDYGTMTIHQPEYHDLDINEELTLDTTGMHHESCRLMNTTHPDNGPHNNVGLLDDSGMRLVESNSSEPNADLLGDEPTVRLNHGPVIAYNEHWKNKTTTTATTTNNDNDNNDNLGDSDVRYGSGSYKPTAHHYEPVTIYNNVECHKPGVGQDNRPSENADFPLSPKSVDAAEDQGSGMIEEVSFTENQSSIPLRLSKTEIRDFAQCFINSPDFVTMFKTPAVADQEDAKPLAVNRGRVQVKGVDFSYDSSKPLLKKINFQIEPRQTVALVGDTGVGKSTILKLIMRLYNPLRGAITIDGQNIAHVTQRSLRENIGVVPQDPVLFNDTLLNNIRYANISASEEQIYEACEAVSLRKTFSAYKNGYQTLVGKRGVKLSAGELQQVAIARIMVKKPKIILLDEPTSNVDSNTEAQIQESLAKLCHGRTTFLIANRLSTAVNADKILVVNDGKIVQQGSHNSLLRKRGEYSRLWKRHTT